jgi:hypothetical protein
MQEKPNLTASQTTRIASLLLHSAQDRLWPAIDFVLGDDNREVNDADMTRIFNTLKALI